MKKLKLALGLMILPFIGVSQSTTATNNQNGGQTRYLGFDNNFSLRTVTNGVTRIRLNGSLVSNITGYTANDVSGYMGLGSGGFASVDGWFNANAPLTLLQLKGRNGTFIQTMGYRPWMQTGISLTDNQDFSYFGLRKVGSGYDVTETTISWSDNIYLST